MSKLKIGKWAHDVACRYKKWEGKLVSKVYLDGYHSKGHKCKMKAIKYSPSCNSQACEQLWSRLDKLGPSACNMTRAHYRYFWYNYGKWRNAFVRSAYYTPENPRVSRKKMKKHGKY